MKEHTTHFEDCGCLAAQHAAEIAKALAERDVAKGFHDLAVADRNLAWARVAAAYDLLSVIHQDGGHYVNRVGVISACTEALEVVTALREQKKYAAEECVRVSNENVRLRKAITAAKKKERAWWRGQLSTCENGGDIADVIDMMNWADDSEADDV